MALAASLNARIGIATVRTAVTGSATVVMDGFLPRSDFKRARKLGRGRPRNSTAMAASADTSASADGKRAPGFCRISCTIASSCSARLRLAILRTRLLCALPRMPLRSLRPLWLLPPAGFETLPQVCQRSELQLFHRSLTAPELLGDVADTLLLRKPHHHYTFLIRRKLVHQPV